MITARPRKLHSGHFAFMRAVVQGLDASASWSLYLGRGAVADAHVVRSKIALVRNEFSAAAKREMMPGTTRLVLIDAGHLAYGRARPALGEFALAPGMKTYRPVELAASRWTGKLGVAA